MSSFRTDVMGYYENAEEYFAERDLPYDECVLHLNCKDMVVWDKLFPLQNDNQVEEVALQ